MGCDTFAVTGHSNFYCLFRTEVGRSQKILNSSGVHLDALTFIINNNKEIHMTKKQPQQTFNIGRMVKKFFLSSFVVFTFVAYVINQRITKPDSALSLASTHSSIVTPQVFSSSLGVPPNSPIPAQQGDSSANTASTFPILPTPTSQSSAATNGGLYKDGTYTGPQVAAYYGLVEVQATVQNGKIVNVQFLQYPSDRRTSVRINTIAMPYLQQEALQVQSAHVNIISGATFTSEGFAMSLVAALNSAKN